MTHQPSTHWDEAPCASNYNLPNNLNTKNAAFHRGSVLYNQLSLGMMMAATR